MLDRLRDAIDRAIVWGNRAPWLAIRRLLWFFTFGWLLATVYLAAAVAMLASIICAPFCYQAARLALLAADGGITLEPAADRFVLSLEVRGWVKRVPSHQAPASASHVPRKPQQMLPDCSNPQCPLTLRPLPLRHAAPARRCCRRQPGATPRTLTPLQPT